MQKIILFYKFVPVADTESVRFWQKSLADSLGLRGRIIISRHGINGTLGGPLINLKTYIKETKTHSLFKGIDWKWSDGQADDFPRLSVKVRSEIVTFGVPDEIKVTNRGITGGGKHLNPSQVHDLVAKKGEKVVFLDGRNAYEAAIGRFNNAVVPSARTAKDFKKELKKPYLQKIKNRPVVTYCTGGIRCEVLSTLMKKEGFKEVYQMKGGIARYGKQYKDDGFWQGKMYVFDKRMSLGFSEKAQDIGQCRACKNKTSNYENCVEPSCNDLILLCADCVAKELIFCHRHSLERPAIKK